jgi:hypothetical protein
MLLHLSCQDFGIDLSLPAANDDVKRTLSTLRDGLEPNAPVRISGVCGNAYSLHGYIRQANLENGDDLQKLNQLAKLFDGIGVEQQEFFSGALDAESINGLDDVLRVASSLAQYEFIEGVTTDKELGGWLVEHGLAGVDFPEQVRPYLDYAGIGAAYYSDHGGAYTAHGYVKRRETVQTQAVDDKPVFALTLASALGTYRLNLPASDNDLANARLTVGSLGGTIISDVQIGYSWGHLLPLDSITPDDANTLAQYVRSMSETELRTFGAAMEAEEPTAFSDAVCIAEDIDNYELVDVTEGEYARNGLRMAGVEDEIFDLLDGFTDFERLGRSMMEEDGVQATSFGSIKRLSAPFPQQPEMGQTMY